MLFSDTAIKGKTAVKQTFYDEEVVLLRKLEDFSTTFFYRCESGGIASVLNITLYPVKILLRSL